MGIGLLVTLIFYTIGFYHYHHSAYFNRKDILQSMIDAGTIIGVVVCVLSLAFNMIMPMSAYNYKETYASLQSVNDNYIIIETDNICYVEDNKIWQVSSKYSNIYITENEEPHMIKREFRGFNAQNTWRWLYTIPVGHYYEYDFYIPRDKIYFKIKSIIGE